MQDLKAKIEETVKECEVKTTSRTHFSEALLANAGEESRENIENELAAMPKIDPVDSEKY